MEPAILVALIGALGVGSQWLAWRLQMPAIVLMLSAGLLAGPVLGLIDPDTALGDLFSPLVSIAVAVILFEGGLTLNFRELRGTAPAVRRMVYAGAPLGWLFSTLACRYGAGLSWESATVFGGILVVTGPTVIIPLLRQARMKARPASILRWEAIVNDPVGALCAVLAFEVITALAGSKSLLGAAEHLALGILLAAAVGWGAGRAIVFAFANGHVPEYMKVSVLLGAVLAVYASTDSVLHESGLLAVTVMGVVLANAHLPSFDELRRFKEHMTVLLVSGVFILLAASMEADMLGLLDWRAVVFVVLLVFVVRPLVVFLALAGSDLPFGEKAIIAWIAPRGVVAVAVAGLFGTRLTELGIPDGQLLAPLAFCIVAATVVLHGFSIVPAARLLGVVSADQPGVMIVGSSRWAVGLAAALRKAGVPVLIADRNWYRLRVARSAGVPVYHGEILSEAAEHTLDMNGYEVLIAATDNDAYNTLVCADFGPEFGRTNVFQIGRGDVAKEDRDLRVTLTGRRIGEGRGFGALAAAEAEGAEFVVTPLTEEYGLDAFLADRPDTDVWALIRKGGRLAMRSGDKLPEARPGDRVVAQTQRAKAAAAG